MIVISIAIMVLSLASVSAGELDQAAISDSSFDDSIIVDDPVTDSFEDESLDIDDYVPELPSDDTDIDDADEDTSIDTDDDPINSDINDDDSIIINITNDTNSKGNDAPISNVKTDASSFDELQSLIDQLPSGTTLYLYHDYKGAEDKQITINKDLTIDGQGHTIDCASLCRGIWSKAGNICLMNLNINNGYINGASGNDQSYFGAAIYIENAAKYTIKYCKFNNNYADDFGGAIYNIGKYALTLDNCIFKDNYVDDYYGGAIYSKQAVIVSNSEFYNNHACKSGGAIHTSNDYNRNIISKCIFKDNYAGSSGGAIFLGGTSDINNTSFINNFACEKGGGIYTYLETRINKCTFEGNKADSTEIADTCGGAIYAYFGDLYISASSFYNNYADDEGGAIFCFNKNLYINHDQESSSYTTIFSGNIADDYDGGAIKCLHTAIIKYTQFNSNKAYTNGGAISLEAYSQLTNCLFNANRCEGASSKCKGGAIYSKEDFILIDCILNNNYAEDYGGAAYSDSAVTANGCSFDSNTAENHGGAIYAKFVYANSDKRSSPSKFSNNHASNDNGGAVYITDIGAFYNTEFNSNTALVDGGAIFAKGNVDVNTCTFNSNQANGAKSASCYGGAIRANGVGVTNSAFKNNLAENDGGAIYADFVSLYSGVFEGNLAFKGNGGAIYTNTFYFDVKNATFYNNKAEKDGGAIYLNKENHIKFSQCTFVINHAGDEGGAIYLDSTGSYIQLINNIFHGNTADDGWIVFNKGSYGSIYNNWWGDVNPTYDLPMLVEWKAWFSNENKIDSDPLRIEIRTNGQIHFVGDKVRATLYFITSDGSIFDGEMPTAAMAFILPEGLRISNYGFTKNTAFVDFVVEEEKIYNLIGNLYGQFATATMFCLKPIANCHESHADLGIANANTVKNVAANAHSFPTVKSTAKNMGKSKFGLADKSISNPLFNADFNNTLNIFLNINSLICKAI